MGRYLIDNNVIANFTAGKFSENVMFFLADVLDDAIIAATAIVHDYTLLTSDLGFNRISNLKVVNPFDL